MTTQKKTLLTLCLAVLIAPIAEARCFLNKDQSTVCVTDHDGTDCTTTTHYDLICTGGGGSGGGGGGGGTGGSPTTQQRHALNRGLPIASQRLTDVFGCGNMYSELNSQNNVGPGLNPLNGHDVLAGMEFVNASGSATCQSINHRGMYTYVGLSTVYLCRDINDFTSSNLAMLFLHESLHVAGARERVPGYPDTYGYPTSADYSGYVRVRCNLW